MTREISFIYVRKIAALRSFAVAAQGIEVLQMRDRRREALSHREQVKESRYDETPNCCRARFDPSARDTTVDSANGSPGDGSILG